MKPSLTLRTPSSPVPQSVVDELVGTGSSVAEFSVGETFTGLDMLYLMMVPSGNNAALTLAKYVDQLYAEGKLDTSSQEESASSGEEKRFWGRGL